MKSRVGKDFKGRGRKEEKGRRGREEGEGKGEGKQLRGMEEYLGKGTITGEGK